MTPEKIDKVMTTLIDKMEVKYTITGSYSMESNRYCGTIHLHKDNKCIGYWFGYTFYFKYLCNTLIPLTDDSLITDFDLFKLLPPKLVNDYFSDKVMEHIRKYRGVLIGYRE